MKFLKKIDTETPAELDLHLIVDNYATHKHPKVQSWLKRHQRFTVHFIPTSSSWLNVIERWFRDITDQRIAAACSVASLSWRQRSKTTSPSQRMPEIVHVDSEGRGNPRKSPPCQSRPQ